MKTKAEISFEMDLQQYQEDMKQIFTNFQQKQVELFNKYLKNEQ